MGGGAKRRKLKPVAPVQWAPQKNFITLIPCQTRLSFYFLNPIRNVKFSLRWALLTYFIQSNWQIIIRSGQVILTSRSNACVPVFVSSSELLSPHSPAAGARYTEGKHVSCCSNSNLLGDVLVAVIASVGPVNRSVETTAFELNKRK